MIIAVNFPTSAAGKKKPEKNQGFNGIRTCDLRDTGAILSSCLSWKLYCDDHSILSSTPAVHI